MMIIEKDQMPAIHPGEHLREDFLIPLAMSSEKLAIALDIPTSQIQDIVCEKCGISPEMAFRLAKFFATTPEYWLQWQKDYDLRSLKK